MTKQTEAKLRYRLAKHATAIPDFITSEKGRADFRPHPELTRIADDLSNGRSLKEIAIRAWTYQDAHDMPHFEAARMRTIYRRIMRKQYMPEVAE